MNCKEIELILTEAPDTQSAEVQAHLADCRECRRFAAFQRSLLAPSITAVPANVDKAVRDAATFRLARRRHQVHQRYRWLAAAAALFLLVGWLTFLSVPTAEQNPRPLAGMTKRPAQESVWADGKLEAALKGLEEQAKLLSQPIADEPGQKVQLPTLDELDNDLLNFELKFYFERAVLGTVDTQASG